MKVSFGPRGEAFRSEIRAWLASNLPSEWGTPAFTPTRDEAQWYEWRRGWDQKLLEAGYACPHWPKVYGGQGLGLLELTILYEELGRVGAPEPVNHAGKNLLGPILMQYGTPWQQQRFLPGILHDKEIWCQGYSEPGAGSDLASLRTRAVPDGDTWVINGQKIWTSGAQHADWCFCLARTDVEAPKHRGLTLLLVPMRQPGITVRSVRQITGDFRFNELFFDAARTAKENVVGQVNDGWNVAVSLLAHERGPIAIMRENLVRRDLYQLIEYAGQVPRGCYTRASDDPYLRHRLAQAVIDLENLRLTNYRYLSRYLKGERPGPEGSVTKICWSELFQQVAELTLEVMGPLSDLGSGAEGAPWHGYFAHTYLWSRSRTISGGTSEIQRNIIAERILGLPR